MLIKKIELENFRQFVGKQEIKFSTDRTKNITFVIGENGSGKTTIAQAFFWCLWGKTPGFSKKENEDILSEREKDAVHANCNVSIEITHNGENYTVSRNAVFSSGRQTLISTRMDFVEKGESITITGSKDVERKIKELLPEDLSEYFFLTGEKIEGMSDEIKAGKSKSFADAVNRLLGLGYYKKAIKHLSDIKKEYEQKQIPNDNDVNRASEKIKQVDEKIEECSSSIENAQKNCDDYKDDLDKLRMKLKGIKSSKKIQEEKERKEEETQKIKDKLERKIVQTIKMFSGDSNEMGSAPYFFSQNLFLNEIETLNEVLSVPANEVPDKLHADLIDWIEKHHRCICGSEIMDGNDGFEKLERLRKIVPPESISTLVKTEKDKVLGAYRLGKNLFQQFKWAKEEIDGEMQNLEGIDQDIEKLTDELRSLEDTSELQNKIDWYSGLQKNSEKQLLDFKVNLERLKEKKEEYKKEQQSALERSSAGKFVLECKAVVERLLQKFRADYKEAETEKRNELIKSVKNAFVEIYGNSFSIEINDDYAIKTSSDLEKSAGQGMCVIFAFLAGLLDVIQKNQTRGVENDFALESYPLVLDAPFSALDEKRIASICEVLPKVSSQIVIFIKDTDGKVAQEKLKDRIGKSYSLDKLGSSDNLTKISEK